MSNSIQISEQIDALETIAEFEEEVLKNSESLISMAIKIIPFGCKSGINLIDEQTEKRYIGINSAIFTLLKTRYGDEENLGELCDDSVSTLMLSWIALGSALEASFQIFLSAFKHDYDNNPAQKWKSFESKKVRDTLNSTLKSIQKEGAIDSKKRNRIIDDIDRTLKIKESGLSLEKITLYDLINYFNKSVWEEKRYFDYLDMIRENRNVIHSFQKRQLDGWESFSLALRIYLLCIIDLQGTMSYLEDAVDDMTSDCYY